VRTKLGTKLFCGLTERAPLTKSAYLQPARPEQRTTVSPVPSLRSLVQQGPQLFWTWKSRHGQCGRPALAKEIRQLIRRMSRDNPLWGAPKIHGELLKLGIEISESTVSKYLVRGRGSPSQSWRTFLKNHLQEMVSADFFTVPTIRFQILYVFLVLAHERRRIVHFAVTAHPTAD
jgi:hypothetical protein